MGWKKIAFALLSLIAPAAASYVGGDASVCYANLGSNAIWIGMAFMLTVLLVALAYMLGKGSEDEQVQVWAKDEVFALGVSALIVAGVVAFTIGSCLTLSAISNQDGMGQYQSANPFSSSYRYLDALASRGLSSIESQTKQGLQKQLDATAYLYVGLPTLTSTGVPLKASRKALAQHQEMVIDIMLPLVVSLKAQRAALQIIEIVGLAIMLPFAIIMRIVPFTRNAGNFMLAAVFCMFVIVPAVYVLSASAWKGIESPQGGSVLVSDPQAFSFDDRAIGAACDGEGVDCPLYRIASLIPQAIFMPNLVIVVFITCTMALSRALGALPV